MSDLKEYIFVLPLITAILALISLIFPSAELYLFGIAYLRIWMVGIASFAGQSGFAEDSFFLLLSFLCSVSIVISAIMLFISTREMKNKSGGKNISLITGIILIGIVIIYMVGLEILFASQIPSTVEGTNVRYSFWSIMNLGFGLIGLILAGILAIISGILFNYFGGIKSSKIPTTQREQIPVQMLNSKENGVKFCPECGEEVLIRGKNFCTYCGTKLSY